MHLAIEQFLHGSPELIDPSNYNTVEWKYFMKFWNDCGPDLEPYRSEWEVFTHYIYPTPEGLSEHDHDLHPEAEDIHLQVQDAYDSMEPQERDAIKHHEAAFWESFRLWNEHNTTMFKDRTPERLQHDADLRQEFERRRRIFDMTTRKWRAFRYYIW
jgi:hypothetical protein